MYYNESTYKHMRSIYDYSLKRIAKKYRNRCEPELLMRMMYVDEVTASRLSEYGAKELGLRPKRWRR